MRERGETLHIAKDLKCRGDIELEGIKINAMSERQILREIGT